jgi:hypothetical protein
VADSHFYLWSELSGLPILALALSYAGDLRRSAVIAGLLLTLFVSISVIHEGTYWRPQRLFGGPIGIEDVLFLFRFGALSWLGTFWLWRTQLRLGSPALKSLRFVGLCTAAAAFCAWLLSHVMGAMHVFIVVQAGLAAFLMTVRPLPARVVLSGLILFPSYYALHVLLLASLLPGFSAMWTGSQPYLATIMGIPLEEFLWTFSAGICFPFLLAVACNLELEPPRRMPSPGVSPTVQRVNRSRF